MMNGKNHNKMHDKMMSDKKGMHKMPDGSMMANKDMVQKKKGKKKMGYK